MSKKNWTIPANRFNFNIFRPDIVAEIDLSNFESLECLVPLNSKITQKSPMLLIAIGTSKGQKMACAYKIETSESGLKYECVKEEAPLASILGMEIPNTPMTAKSDRKLLAIASSSQIDFFKFDLEGISFTHFHKIALN